jgi:hypothetical protein
MSQGVISGNGYGAIPSINTVAVPGLSLSASSGQLPTAHEDIIHRNHGLTIRVVPANGGHIINIRDDNNYSSSGELHIINQDKDLGEELGKIITLHYLKK